MVVIEFYSKYPKKESNKFRKHDNKTPYYTHPLSMGMLILEDNQPGVLESYDNRLILAISAMLHDIIEDTTKDKYNIEKELQKIIKNKNIINKIIDNVELYTIDDNMNLHDKFNILKNYQDRFNDDVYYIKLVDKWYNMFYPTYFINQDILDNYKNFLNFLVLKVKEGKYNNSRFINLAKCFIQN